MLINVQNLSVRFGAELAVNDISLTLRPGEKLALVGESGSGKSTLGKALLGLVAKPGIATAKRLEIVGRDMRHASARQWRNVRGKTISLMLQDPRYSLNPVMTIGQQIRECAKDVEACLQEVGLPPEIAKRYPHQLSGGQGQRAFLAMMLALSPKLLIADEPTSALDPPLALQMMALINERIEAHGMGLLLITHDIELAMQSSSRLLVMQNGRVVEELRPGEAPQHPFTQRLIASVPRPAC